MRKLAPIDPFAALVAAGVPWPYTRAAIRLGAVCEDPRILPEERASFRRAGPRDFANYRLADLERECEMLEQLVAERSPVARPAA